MRVKLTSQRTGKVGWLRLDGTPTDYASEAGEGLTPEVAQGMIDEYIGQMTAATGRCRWTFEILFDSVVQWQVHTGHPSWHQRKGGHDTAGAMFYTGDTAERDANAYAAKYRVDHPDQPCFVRRERV